MESRMRFSDVEWFKEASDKDISIIGLGGIGSWLTIPLSRIGENELYLYDKDTFEPHNLAGQLISKSEVGKEKVEIASKNINNYSEGNIVNKNGLFNDNSIVTPIIFVCVDSISVRKMIFDKWYKEYGKSDMFNAILIDGRMNLESYQLFTVLPGTKELKEYMENELNEEGLQELPCTLKATTHIAQMLAAEMVSVFTNWLTKHSMRLLPYYLRKDIPMWNYERRLYAI